MSDNSRLVTEQTVREAAAAGRGINAGPGTVITPAARDLAHQLGVPLTAPTTASPSELRTLALGADHGGFRLKEALKPVIMELGFQISDVGCGSTDPVDYPVYAARVAELVAG